MQNKFDQCFSALMENEGGYVHDPSDPGGETNWGITIAVARSNGYTGAMREMPIDTAKTIYHRKYWEKWMECAPMPLAFELFDCAVNCGLSRSAKLLQRSLGITEDGVVGPKTMAAASSVSPVKLWSLFVAAVIEYRSGLDGWKHYSRGWTRRAAANLRRGARYL